MPRYVMRQSYGSYFDWDVIDLGRSRPGQPYYVLARVSWQVAMAEVLRLNAA